MENTPINIIENLKELLIRIIHPLLKSFPFIVVIMTTVFLLILGILSAIFS